MPARDCKPTKIMGTSAVTPVDEEVTLTQSCDGEHIVRLGFDVNPGAVSQSWVREPVQLVWSEGVEFELFIQFASRIEDNPRLLNKTQN